MFYTKLTSQNLAGKGCENMGELLGFSKADHSGPQQ